ncbi:hypothetical protein V2G26_006424 [Clonostachys chloroleuca]|uniref:Uncharacterized protein n=1 Tax=Clonostachys chloroleuca TaxID=1926264 RepID=A0AA35M409_9HYPO|nr:unnamed protein product [Clonostachys chloroleuca]
MALSTKSLIQWAESIRSMFKMEESATKRNELAKSNADKTAKQASDSEAENSEEANEATEEPEMSLSDRMEQDKQKFPGAKEWAREEERLFEIFYLRQDIPILPPHWSIDLRGFPLTDHIFQTSKDYPPVIYSHSETMSGQFAATHVLSQLIDLTLSVRTLIESENLLSPTNQRTARRRVAKLVKARLDKTLGWAARDGSYDKLKVIPNIIAEIVEAPEEEARVVAYMTARIRALAMLQREHLRVDRSDDFWTSTEPRLMRPKRITNKSLTGRIRAGMKRSLESTRSTPDLVDDDTTIMSPDSPATVHDTEYRSLKRRQIASPCSSDDELTEVDGFGDLATPYRVAPKSTTTPPRTPANLEFRRKPPVVYGLYILGTNVFVLTLDSSKGDAGIVSFQVHVDFFDKNQSVWNALTLAVPICAARDELMTRLEDFSPLPAEEEVDPDA